MGNSEETFQNVCVCVCVYIVGHQRESDNLRSIQIGVRITKRAKFHKEAQDNRMFVNQIPSAGQSEASLFLRTACYIKTKEHL